MILTGDIGGTHTRLALWQWESAQPELIRKERYESHGIRALADWILSFLGETPKDEIEGAVICLAGPGERDCCQLTNQAFSLDYAALRLELGFLPFLDFYNDLEALAAAVPLMKDEDLFTVKEGKTVAGDTKAVIAPGTGLGESFLLRGTIPCPSEGGHGDFAPQTGEQWALYRFLADFYDHVSYERVLSGPGLVDLHRFCSFMEGKNGGDLDGNMISRLALMGNDPLCLRALSIFRDVLGAEAGNLALRTLALGGVYIGGGIAPQIAAFLNNAAFREAFTAKGRFRSLLGDIPVHIITHQDGPLLGACALARQSL